MYEIIKSVITSGRYELSDMLKKIDTIWLQGSITDEHRVELVTLAQAKADPKNSYAPLQNQINALFKNVEELAKEIQALKNGASDEEATEKVKYPAWVKWEGYGAIPWQNGSTCTHNDRYFLSHVDNNVWEPGALGVYDNIWEDITEQVLAEQNNVTEDETE